MKVTVKLADLGVPTPAHCNWILNFQTDRQQVVGIERKVSAELQVRTHTLKGCCLSHKLRLISERDESPYRDPTA